MSGALTVKAKAKDWHSSKHIHKRAQYLLEHPDEQIPSDVTFLVGDGQNEPQKTFKCHKLILAMVSSMFQAMFYGTLPETEDTIKIPDVTPVAFQHMLRYAYGEIVDLDDECLEDALDILYCAKKYLIEKLARACRDHIQLHSFEFDSDPCVVLQRAPQLDEEDLATLARSGIAHCTGFVMKGDALLCLSFDCLKRIVDYHSLSATEGEVYQGVIRWVEHNVGAVKGSVFRNALGSLLYSIRFPLFTATELANGPATDGALTGDEASSIFRFLFADAKPTLPFLTAPRVPLAASLDYYLTLVTVPADALADEFDSDVLILTAYPALAPQCCAFLRHLVESKLHIRIASYDNEHPGMTVPIPGAVQEERNLLSHSIKGACWFEWDIEGNAARNIRIGTGRKPHVPHSGFLVLLWALQLGKNGCRSACGITDIFTVLPTSAFDKCRNIVAVRFLEFCE